MRRTLEADSRMLITGVIILVFLIPIMIYVVVVMLEVPGLAEERLGRLEPLPAGWDEWRPDTESEAGKAAMAQGLERQTRIFAQSQGWLGRERLVLQSRYRNPTTGEIERVEADARYRRRRVRSGSARSS